VTLVSDLAHNARDAFIGIDNRMAGQTAAFVLGTFFTTGAAKVGVMLGDYDFSCHEDREIGFRNWLRANFPNIQIVDIAKTDDSPERTFEATTILLRENPEIDGIYNVAGGNAGLAEAIRDTGRSNWLHHEVRPNGGRFPVHKISRHYRGLASQNMDCEGYRTVIAGFSREKCPRVSAGKNPFPGLVEVRSTPHLSRSRLSFIS
jgi:Periplasmic binding protein domain